MTVPVRVDVEVGSPEWHAERRRGITASEIPIILGIAPWGSPFNLYWAKRGLDVDEPDNDAMEWGHELEDVILRRFARKHPEFHVTPGGLYRHGGNPRWMATPDGIAYDTENVVTMNDGVTRRAPSHVPVAVVQVKTAGSREEWGEEGTDQIPPYYLAQVRWEMHVMGVDTAFVPVLFNGRTYREYIVKQDDVDVALMVREAEAFWQRIQDGNPPDVDWRPATTLALKKLHPDVEDTEVELPADLIRQWQAADEQIREAKRAKDEAENRIRDLLGKAARGTVNGRKVATRSVYDVRERVMPATTVNRLTITRKDLDA